MMSLDYSGISEELSSDLHIGGRQQSSYEYGKAQLVFAAHGLMTCQVADELWLVPPNCALWVPEGVEFDLGSSEGPEKHVLLVDRAAVPGLPYDKCRIVAITPLLRELLIAVARLPSFQDKGGPGRRLMLTMLDELAKAPMEQTHLTVPSDPRLRRIAERLLTDPSDRATVGEWASRVAMSERSLFRLIQQRIGMSFGRWRRQIQLMWALQRLSEGQAVQTVAFDLGYESASAFITMFKKILGQPPRQYLANAKTVPSGLI